MSKPPPQKAAWFRYTDAASVGLEIVVAVTICTFAARWLEDNVTHWSPWTTLIGIGVGLAAATKAITRAARNYKRAIAAEDAANAERRARATEEGELASASDRKEGIR